MAVERPDPSHLTSGLLTKLDSQLSRGWPWSQSLCSLGRSSISYLYCLRRLLFRLVLLVYFYYQICLHKPKGLCLLYPKIKFSFLLLLGWNSTSLLCLTYTDLIDLSRLNKSFLAQKAASVKDTFSQDPDPLSLFVYTSSCPPSNSL